MQEIKRAIDDRRSWQNKKEIAEKCDMAMT